MNKIEETELSRILETLMYSNYEDTTPCEAGLHCPFYEKNNPWAYCTNGNCVEGMTKLIKGLCEK
jgi:hypothetical protein